MAAGGAIRTVVLALPVLWAATPETSRAEPDLVGSYRVAEGPDVAGMLEVAGDGRFRYALVAGALDEWAEGRWEADGPRVCLHTEPRPAPPVFSLAPPESGDDPAPSLLVTWPDGTGIPGVDFRLGLDTGEVLEGYTQHDGWSLPEDDPRVPVWVELSVPMYALASPRLEPDGAAHGKLRVVLTPNDLGVVDFQGACVEARPDGAVLHRPGGDVRLSRLER